MKIKNFHFVPQCYLRAFSTGNERLRAIDKKENRIFYTSPRNLCAERDYYLFDDLNAPESLKYSFEEFLSRSIEPIYARLHESKLSERMKVTDEESRQLAHFALWQFWRSPIGREVSDSSGVHIPGRTVEVETRVRHIVTAMKNVFYAFECGNFRIEIYEAEGDNLFPTSDQPCMFCGVDPVDGLLYFINDFDSFERFKNNHHFGMPISPNFYLFLFLNHIDGDKTTFHVSEGAHFEHLLDKIATSARRFIIDPHPTRNWSQRR